MKPKPSTVSAPHENNDAPHSKTSEDIALDKQILRSQIRPQRLIAKNARTAAEHEQMAQQYRDHILSLIPKDAQAQTIAAYLPTASEPPITAALHELHARGHRILVPVVRPARTLAWVVWDPHVEHPLNGLGIAEPGGEEYDTQAFVAADLRLVPALAYARNGRRLGQGGGYYDRIIPTLSADKLRESTVGVVFSHEVLESIPYDEWDAVLPRVLTENGIEPLGDSAL